MLCSRLLTLLLGIHVVLLHDGALADCPSGGASTVMPTGAGVIESDPDGDGPGTVNPTPRTCTWVATCAAGQQVEVTRLVGDLTVDQFSTMVDMLFVGEVRMAGQLSVQSTPVTFRNSSLSLEYRVAAPIGSRSRQRTSGWRLEYRCVAEAAVGTLPWTRCPAQEHELTLASDSVRVDLDGIGSSPHFPEWDCQWRIRCPDTAARIELRVQKDTRTDLRLTRGDGGLALPVSDTTSTFTLPMSEVALRLTRGGSRPGLAFNYVCIHENVGLSTGCPSNQPAPLLERFGAIQSDADGAGSVIGDQTPRTCQWEVRCPPRHLFSVLGALGGLAYDQFRTTIDFLHVEGVRFSSAIDPLPGPLVLRRDMHTGSLGAAGLSYIVRAPIGSRSRQLTTGWSLTYGCVREPTRHELPYIGCREDTFRSLNDTMMSDLDGSGPYEFSAGQNCVWHIRCPQHMHISLAWSVSRTTVTLSSTVGSATLVDSASNQLVPSNAATISTTATITSGGITAAYTCVPPAATSDHAFSCSTVSPVVLTKRRGSILADLDGEGASVRITHGGTPRTCLWRIQCPSNQDTTANRVNFTRAVGTMGTDQFSTPLDTLTIDSYSSQTFDGAAIVALSFASGAAVDISFTVGLPIGSRSRRGSNGWRIDYECTNPSTGAGADDAVTCSADVHCSGNGNLTAASVGALHPSCTCDCRIGWAGARCERCAANYSEFPLACQQERLPPWQRTVTASVNPERTATLDVNTPVPTPRTATRSLSEQVQAPPQPSTTPVMVITATPKLRPSTTAETPLAPARTLSTVVAAVSPSLMLSPRLPVSTSAARTPTRVLPSDGSATVVVSKEVPPLGTRSKIPSHEIEPPSAGSVTEPLPMTNARDPTTTATISLLPEPPVVQEEEVSYPIADSPATQSVTTAAAAAGAAMGVGGAADLQALGVASLITCANRELKAAAGAAKRSLLPIEIGDGEGRFIVGLFVVLGAVFLVQLVASIIAYCAFPSCETYLDACAMVRFPTVTAAVMDVCAQGFTLEGMRLVSHTFDDASVVVLGTAGLTLWAIHLSVGLWTLRTVVPEKAVFVEYFEALEAAPRPLRKLVAQGRWCPSHVRHRLGAYFNAWRPEGIWATRVALVRPLLVGILASLDAPSHEWCIAQFAALGALFACSGCAILVFRPFRAPGRNVFSALSAIAAGIVLGSPAVESAASAIPYLVLTSSLMSVALAATSGAFNLFESMKMKKIEPEAKHVEIAAAALLLPPTLDRDDARDNSSTDAAQPALPSDSHAVLNPLGAARV